MNPYSPSVKTYRDANLIKRCVQYELRTIYLKSMSNIFELKQMNNGAFSKL